MRTCKEIVDNHFDTFPIGNIGDWQQRHMYAWGHPSRYETGIRGLIVAFASLADGYAAQTEGERLLGQDGYYHEHARSLIEAMRAYLNFDVGRFDCGTLDRLICDLAAAAGVEMDP